MAPAAGGIGRRNIMMSSRSCFIKRKGREYICRRQPRRIPAGISRERISGGIRVMNPGDPCKDGGPGPQVSGHPWRSVRCSCPPMLASSAYLGDWAYDSAIWINTVMSRVRSLFSCATGHSAWAKFRSKKAVNFIGQFEECGFTEEARIGVDR